MFHGSAYPKEISQQCAPATHIQKQCTTRRSSWGLPSPSPVTKGSWMHLRGGSPSLSSALWRPPPEFFDNLRLLETVRCAPAFYSMKGTGPT